MNSSEIKKRSSYWDNMKGILIFLVVFAHFLYQDRAEPMVGKIVGAIYFFHMPVFVFISGYFGKSEHSRSISAIAKLIFSYFIFNTAMCLISGIDSVITPAYSYWYLAALIFWRLTAHHAAKFKDINIILIALSLFAGFFSEINNAFAAARIISFYPFYMAGYQLTEEKALETENLKAGKKILKGILFLILSVCSVLIFSTAVTYTDNTFQCFPYSEPMDFVGRTGFFFTAFCAAEVFLYLSPKGKIPFLTMIGRNSFSIFVLHRPFTLIFSDMFDLSPQMLIISSILCSFIICFAFGNDVVSEIINKFAGAGAKILTKASNTDKKSYYPLAAKTISACLALGFISLTFTNLIKVQTVWEDAISESSENTASDVIYRTVSDEKQTAFDNAFRITFAGDLILLEDQVKRGYKENGYNFDDVFEYAAPHISSADLAIGVFEGPMAGEEAGYSTSNYDDGKYLALNFPDEFADAVINAGFDLVTTANNHVLDKGTDGAKRTLDVLDEKGLSHTGSYRNEEEKKSERVKIIDTGNIRFAVLSYTYGCSYTSAEELADGGNAYITSVISGTEGELFEKLKNNVREDFEEAKKHSPDLIIVLPHIGTQFSNGIDAEQETWFKIFAEYGADIILGDHPHAVEPVSLEEINGKKVFSAYCPGNFANIYREYGGDTSALIDVYIDRNSKKIIGGGIVPLYTESPADGNYRALPVYEMMKNPVLRRELSTDDLERARSAHDTVTGVMLGVTPDISGITESYLFDEEGFFRVKTTGLEITEEMKNALLYPKLENAKSVVFIGDSVTEGTKNGGAPWYEPIEEYLSSDVKNFSKGGATVSFFMDNADVIPSAELYVTAVGTNDVRYRDESICAMTPEEYKNRIAKLKELLLDKNPSAEFIFIAPWYSTDGDKFCPLSFSEKTRLNEEYSDILSEFCRESGDIFIDPNPYIRNRLEKSPAGKYLIDHIHPNASDGIIMYSEAVLSFPKEE